MTVPIVVRAFGHDDLGWAEAILRRSLGGHLQARRGEVVDVLDLPGLVAEREGRPLGLLTYRIDQEGCELVAVVASERGNGVGTALVEALVEEAEAAECRRIWVVTTNDNLDALRFYQRRGFGLTAIRPGAMDEARRSLKPEIPDVGEYGIPLRDELELERSLEA
jgi:ribosomal protein S18 acetylase RimI-like enzyme